jgi:hypothetical protein
VLLGVILQGVRQNIFKHHKRFTDKTLNHIVYIDKKLWDSPDDAFKQKILSDAEKNKNKVIVVYDSATGEKNVIRRVNALPFGKTNFPCSSSVAIILVSGCFSNNALAASLVGSHAYLNRAALVGCKNQLLSENYAKQLYTRRYLRDTSVTTAY